MVVSTGEEEEEERHVLMLERGFLSSSQVFTVGAEGGRGGGREDGYALAPYRWRAMLVRVLLLNSPFPSLPPSLPQVANTYTLWEECLALIDMCHTEDGRGMQDRVQSFWRCIIFNELPANARSPQLKVRLSLPSLPPSLPRF